jgi:toxin ParE1/3/4
VRLVYTDRAKEDLVRITAYVARASGNEGVALRFYRKLRPRCQRIAGLPGAVGTLRPELGAEIRSTSVGNYLILFRYAGAAVEIVTVLEAHRDLSALDLSGGSSKH